MKKMAMVLIQSLIGISVLYFLMKDIGISNMIHILDSAQINYILAGAAVFLLGHFVSSLRIKKTIARFGYDIGYIKNALIHYFGIFVSMITPGRIGYVAISYPMKRNKIPHSVTMAYIGTSQSIDMLMKITFGIISAAGLVYLFHFDGILRYVAYSMAFLGAFSLVVLVFLWEKYPKIPLRIGNKHSLIKKAFANLQLIQKNSGRMKGIVPFYIITAVITWFILSGGWYLIGLSLNMELSYMEYLFIHPIVGLLFFIPLTPAGIGIAETGTVFILQLMGVSPVIALSFSIIIRLVETLAPSIGIASIE